MAVWLVIKDGEVVDVYDDRHDLMNVFDNTYNWFRAQSAPDSIFEATVTQIIPAYSDDDASEGFVENNSDVTFPVTFTPDPRLTMTVPDCKTAVLSMLESRISHDILTAYPVQLQITIRALGVKPGGGNYTSTDVTTMDTFINGRNTLKNTKTTEINALATIANLIAYNVYA